MGGTLKTANNFLELTGVKIEQPCFHWVYVGIVIHGLEAWMLPDEGNGERRVLI